MTILSHFSIHSANFIINIEFMWWDLPHSPSVRSFLKCSYKKFKLKKFLRGDGTFHAMHTLYKQFLNFECEMNCGNILSLDVNDLKSSILTMIFSNKILCWFLKSFQPLNKIFSSIFSFPYYLLFDVISFYKLSQNDDDDGNVTQKVT